MTSILWKVQKVDPGVASVRIRTLAPAHLLRRRGHQITVVSSFPEVLAIASADVVIINKSFSEEDLQICIKAKSLGKKVILDICDDLSEERRSAELKSFCEQAKFASVIVTTGSELESRVRSWIDDGPSIVIVPDIAEESRLLEILVSEFPPSGSSKKARLKRPSFTSSIVRRVLGKEQALIPGRRRIVWFGNAGQSGSGAGLESLKSVAAHLEEVNKSVPIQLIVVTRGLKAFKQATKGFAFPCRYREWTLLGAPETLQSCDVCILPNPPTKFARAKSSNRVLLALNSGVPVVATSIPSIQMFSECIVMDDWYSGILGYLTDAEKRQRDISLGQKLAAQYFGPEVIADKWEALLIEMKVS